MGELESLNPSRPDSDCILHRQDRNHTVWKRIHPSSRSGISTKLKHPRLPIKAASRPQSPQSALRTERVPRKKDYAQRTTVGQDS
ncbi:hypothetical protein CEXT_607931 [Caerostris extrusa]|uniref:Uncharacterized protein n=1 Tax=Caerostris extrusa TaxID=172846 RepID=A0AAV4QAQ0_CAEEX|nr:hypothetical protein CEXT_607931 [Caerostris extrusa]